MGLALFALLRTGSAYSGNGAIEAFQEVLGNLKRGKEIHMRGDSAFYYSSAYPHQKRFIYYLRKYLNMTMTK
jgi:hypothetical protein